MPSVTREPVNDSLEIEDDDSDDASPPGSPSSRKRSPGSWGQRPGSDTRPTSRSDSSHIGGQRSRSLPRASNKSAKGGLVSFIKSGEEGFFINQTMSINIISFGEKITKHI